MSLTIRSSFRCVTTIAALLSGASTAWAAAPLTLQEAVGRALEKNFTVKAAEYGPQIGKAELNAAWGRFEPALEFTYTDGEDASVLSPDPFNPARPANALTITDRYTGGVGGILPFGTRYSVGGWSLNQRIPTNAYKDEYYAFGGIEITQPLLRGFGFGYNLADVRIARTNRAWSEWEYRAALIDTITDVVLVYQDLNFSILNLRAAQRSRDLAQALVSENTRRVEVGSMSEYDVTAARAYVARREEYVLFAERAVEEQRNLLRRLISDEKTMALLEEQLEITTPPPIGRAPESVSADFQKALELRPDYRQSRLNVQRSRHTRDFRANELLPEINFVGSLGYHGYGSTFRESRHRVEERDRRSYTAGAVVRIPLTLREGRSNYRAAKLRLRQAETQLDLLEQAVMVAVANAAGRIETARKRVAATRTARELAQSVVDAQVKLLRTSTNATSTFQVLNYQEQLAGAETAEYRALADEQQAIAEYDRQIGTTLQTWRVDLDEPKS